MTILSYLTERQDDIIQDIKDFVNHESPTYRKELVNECGNYLKGIMSSKLNATVTEFPNDNVGSHLKFTLGEGKEKILILGHYDTVWEKGVLSYRVEDSKAYGPGIFDMKGGIIQAIWALKSLQDLNLKPNKEIVFLLTSDEEQLSPTSRELIESVAKECQAVLVVEPPDSKTRALRTARKGVGKYKIIVEGISSHAGSAPNVQASAVHEVAHQIMYLEKLANVEHGTTINVGVVQGGTMSNVVADSAEADIDVRFYTMEEAERVDYAIKNLNPILTQTKIKVTGGINRPPMEKSDQSIRLYELAKECARELNIEISESVAGGVSDGNFTAAIGVPTLDGLGIIGDGAHALHEHIEINEIAKKASLLALLLSKM